MKSIRDISSTLPLKDKSLGHARGLVAGVLLEHAGNGATERRWLTQRDIANITGNSWEVVHSSLKSLQDEGAIRLERHRLIINKEQLQKIAGVRRSKRG